jgi:hypothetical protein
MRRKKRVFIFVIIYTVAGKAIGFALEQLLHVVALACPASRILKRLQHTWLMKNCVEKQKQYYTALVIKLIFCD